MPGELPRPWVVATDPSGRSAIGSDMLFCQFFAVWCLRGCSRQRWARPHLRRRVAHLGAVSDAHDLRLGRSDQTAGRAVGSTRGVPLCDMS